MHVVTTKSDSCIKDQIREELKEHGIGHVTIEIETSNEECQELNCHIDNDVTSHHHHHHH